MLGQMAWTLGGRFSCSRTWLCLTSSTWLSVSSSWGWSVILISLISLTRAEGTGPHFESVAQNKSLCLTPAWLFQHSEGKWLSLTILESDFSLPSSPVRSWVLSRVSTWTGVQEPGSSKGVFLNSTNSEYIECSTHWETELGSVGIPAPIKSSVWAFCLKHGLYSRESFWGLRINC